MSNMSSISSTSTEDTSSEELYIVESILAKRLQRGTVQYLVKWEGYHEDENTWERVGNFDSMDLIDEFEKERAEAERCNPSRKRKAEDKIAPLFVKKAGSTNSEGSTLISKQVQLEPASPKHSVAVMKDIESEEPNSPFESASASKPNSAVLLNPIQEEPSTELEIIEVARMSPVLIEIESESNSPGLLTIFKQAPISPEHESGNLAPKSSMLQQTEPEPTSVQLSPKSPKLLKQIKEEPKSPEPKSVHLESKLPEAKSVQLESNPPELLKHIKEEPKSSEPESTQYKSKFSVEIPEDWALKEIKIKQEPISPEPVSTIPLEQAPARPAGPPSPFPKFYLHV